jgi:hypothetical protein
MVVVPETLLGRPRVPDPAGETELIRQLVEAKFRVIESSEIARIRYSTEMGNILKEADIPAMKALASRYGCDIFVAGEAFSELVAAPAGSTGVTARARIEVKAFIVQTGEILAADGTVGGAGDQTPAIAAKTALKNAATEMTHYLVTKIRAAINEGRIPEPVPPPPPPYWLYAVAAGLGLLALVGFVALGLQHRYRMMTLQEKAAQTRQRVDPVLTGQGPSAREKRP